MNDSELLLQFVESSSDAAFAELVERHVHAVYSTARRVVQNTHLAEDITQDVFCLLARKARAVPSGVPVVAWLHRAAWHLAMKALRSELRRRARETKAATMSIDASDHDFLWDRIAPMLDEAIESLNQADRSAVLLRFFQRKPAREIGIALGIGEEAARMRISRAVERLRRFFERRGVTCSSVALGAVLTDKSVEAASPMLVAATRAAAASAAKASVPLSLGLKLITLMAQIKLKSAVLSGAALLVALLAGRQVQRVFYSTPDINAGDVTASTTNQTGGMSGSPLARFFSRSTKPADPAEAAELTALERLREILYSPERDVGMPPEGMWRAVEACGSRRRAALELVLQALKSDHEKAQHRAAASLQFFRESSQELMPTLMEIIRHSTDAGLVQYSASSVFALRPNADLMPAMVEAFKSNPAAADGISGWFSMFLHQHPRDSALVSESLRPFLRSENVEQRFSAAMILARTSAKDDPQLPGIFVAALEGVGPQSHYTTHAQSFDALRGLKLIGSRARSAAEAVREYGESMPHMGETVLDTLASIAPDLRAEIPELDAKLKARDEAAILEERSKNNELSVAALIEALQNPEARMQSVETLGKLAGQAAQALPRLREILKADSVDSRPDANNYLFAVATAIRQIDPNAPTYYRPEELTLAFMEATQELKLRSDAAATKLREEAEIRAFSRKPFDRDEIISWIGKFNAANPHIGEAFVRTLKRSPALSQLESDDPELAKAMAR